MNILDYRMFQLENSEKILSNIIKYVMIKKLSWINFEIDDDITCFSTTKGYNEGKRISFFNNDRRTNVFVPIPNVFDFYTYKMIPRIVQNNIVDDVIYFHKNYIKFDPTKCYYRKDRFGNRVVNLKKTIRQLILTWILSTNYGFYFMPHLFLLDDEKFDIFREVIDVVEEEYIIYHLTCTINKRKRNIKVFVHKKLHEECLKSHINNMDEYAKYIHDENIELSPEDVFINYLNVEKDNLDNLTFQFSDISFEHYALTSTIFNEKVYLDLIPDDTNLFSKQYTKNISLASSFFLYLFSITSRKEDPFNKYSRMIYSKASSLKYRYAQAYQQVFIPFEKTVTNVLRKVSKSKKVKDDEVISISTEISRLPTISWNDVYNPYTELRIKSSFTLPFKELSDEMRELDRSMYGIICPIDTGDKDPGKVIRATENLELDEVGRMNSSFAYNDKLLNLFVSNEEGIGHPFIEKYPISDVMLGLLLLQTDKISLTSINEYDSDFKYLNETKIINQNTNKQNEDTNIVEDGDIKEDEVLFDDESVGEDINKEMVEIDENIIDNIEEK